MQPYPYAAGRWRMRPYSHPDAQAYIFGHDSSPEVIEGRQVELRQVTNLERSSAWCRAFQKRLEQAARKIRQIKQARVPERAEL